MTHKRKDECSNADAHTPYPGGKHEYIGHEAWAMEMLKTHVQTQCPDCKLWAIWTPKKPKAPTGLAARRKEASP